MPALRVISSEADMISLMKVRMDISSNISEWAKADSRLSVVGQSLSNGSDTIPFLEAICEKQISRELEC